MINLIKSGAFDEFGDRMNIMNNYIDSVSDKKKRITLQNMAMLIKYNLIPEQFIHQIKVFNFNKYLKKNKLEEYYIVDDIAYRFYEQHYDLDNLYHFDDTFRIKQVVWDKIYKKEMDPVRDYFKAEQNNLLDKLNKTLFDETYNKYCQGSISKWEMDSVSYYSHPHEMELVDNYKYGFADFSKLPDDPIIEKMITIKGKQIPLYKIFRIAGTVLDRDKNKKTVTLLTTSGVVNVKIYGVFANFDKQISQKGADGKKHVIRKSEFSRGNKLIICGIKQDNMFIAKKYARTPYKLIETIETITPEGDIITNNRE